MFALLADVLGAILGHTPNSYYSLGAVVSFSLNSQRPFYFYSRRVVFLFL